MPHESEDQRSGLAVASLAVITDKCDCTDVCYGASIVVVLLPATSHRESHVTHF